MTIGPRTRGNCGLPRALTGGLVVLGLIFSAAALSISGTGHVVGWLGLVGLLPIFAVIRFFMPRLASICGAFWGACIGLFLRPALDAGAGATTLSLSLSLGWTVLASGGFAGLASFLHHRLRLGPLHLALTYLLFEVSLLPLDLGLGLLAATQQGSSFLGIFGGLFGYLLVAFAIAYFDAVLLSVVLTLQLPARRCERNPQTEGSFLLRHDPGFVWIAYPLVDIFARPPPHVGAP